MNITGYYLMETSLGSALSPWHLTGPFHTRVQLSQVSKKTFGVTVCCCLSKCKLVRNKYNLKLSTGLSSRFPPSGDRSTLDMLLLVTVNALHAELPDLVLELGGAT